VTSTKHLSYSTCAFALWALYRTLTIAGIALRHSITSLLEKTNIKNRDEVITCYQSGNN